MLNFSNICYHYSFQDPVWSGASYSSLIISCVPRLLLLIAGNREVRAWYGLQWHNVSASFRGNRSAGSKFKEEAHRDIMMVS
jgi:hypothetical protein